MKKIQIVALTLGFLLVGVVIYAGSGDLIVNGNIGIGTQTPAKKLDVTGDVNISGNMYGNGVKGMIWGGTYSMGCNGGCGGRVNPATGTHSCPTGFTQYVIATVDPQVIIYGCYR